MAGVEMRSFMLPSFENNVYVLIDPDTRDSVLFDAPGDAPRILETLKGTNLRYILMTHADPDHVGALKEVKEATGAPIAIHPAEEQRLPVPPDVLLHDGETIRFGNVDLRAIHTPGHTPGGMSFVTGDTLIAGDTLFPGGPGNTERPISNFDEIINSIRTKLFVLPDETNVYPGHGRATTIGEERPHLDEWITRGY